MPGLKERRYTPKIKMEDNKGIAAFLICVAVLCLLGFLASQDKTSFAGRGKGAFVNEMEEGSEEDMELPIEPTE